MLKKSYEYYNRVFKTHECPGLEGAMVQENFVLLAQGELGTAGMNVLP